MLLEVHCTGKLLEPHSDCVCRGVAVLVLKGGLELNSAASSVILLQLLNDTGSSGVIHVLLTRGCAEQSGALDGAGIMHGVSDLYSHTT